jgi:hypothetical protein
MPSSFLCIFFNTLTVFTSFIIIFLYSILICFDYEKDQFFDNVEKFSIIVYSIDFFIILNTGFYRRGVIQKNRLKIFKNYWKLGNKKTKSQKKKKNNLKKNIIIKKKKKQKIKKKKSYF